VTPLTESLETFSTTADVGIRISGTDFAELYRNAIRGLHLLYFNKLPEETTFTHRPKPYPFSFQGDSAENILVNLLTEVVFLLQNQERVTVDVAVKRADDSVIEADLLTLPLEELPELEIKSVTYHNLAVKESAGRKQAEIVFDI